MRLRWVQACSKSGGHNIHVSSTRRLYTNELDTQKLAWRPRHLAFAHHMQMKVEDRLSCLCTIVDHHTVVVWNTLLASHLLSNQQQMSEQLEKKKEARIYKDPALNFEFTIDLSTLGDQNRSFGNIRNFVEITTGRFVFSLFKDENQCGRGGGAKNLNSWSGTWTMG